MIRLHRSRLESVILATLAIGLGVGGCDSKPSSTPPMLSPGRYFKERQTSTVTPHGKIVIESVAEKDGQIEYKTEDGKQWRVTYSKQADGTYQYGTPEEVK